MSSRPYCIRHDTVAWDKIVELCPKEAYLFQAWLDAHQVTRDEFLSWYKYDDWDELVNELGSKLDLPDDDDGKALDAKADNLKVLWDNLDQAFRKATTVKGTGLNLYAVYDDDGNAYFGVGGVTTTTPAGEKFRADIQDVEWVEYG